MMVPFGMGGWWLIALVVAGVAIYLLRDMVNSRTNGGILWGTLAVILIWVVVGVGAMSWMGMMFPAPFMHGYAWMGGGWMWAINAVFALTAVVLVTLLIGVMIWLASGGRKQ